MIVFILILGILFGAGGVIGYLAVLDYIDDRARVRRLAVQGEQRAAEARIQRVMQDTVTEMFETVRRYL